MNKTVGRKSTCAICDKPITVGRYQDVTAVGRVTQTYLAWGHDGYGLADRGLDDPQPHWAHTEGGDPSGELRQPSPAAHHDEMTRTAGATSH